MAFLVRFHGNNDPNHPLIAVEYKEMKDAITQTASDKRPLDYSEMWKTRNARYRVFLALLMGKCLSTFHILPLIEWPIGVFGQFSGNGLGYFNTEASSDLTHQVSRVLTWL